MTYLSNVSPDAPLSEQILAAKVALDRLEYADVGSHPAHAADFVSLLGQVLRKYNQAPLRNSPLPSNDRIFIYGMIAALTPTAVNAGRT